MDNKKPVILVVSFGTSYLDSIKSSIEAIENDIREAFPKYEIRRAFTSPKILRKLKKRDGLVIDNVKEAMDKLLEEGYESVRVQPTYVIKGFEYDDLVRDVKEYEGKFSHLSLGEPLLSEEKDYIDAASAACEKISELQKEADTAVVFMGHGTDHPGNSTYMRLQKAFDDMGKENCLVATVEAKPDICDIKKKLEERQIKNVYLLPFMIVSGDHANNDMAGDDPQSWKMILKNEGFNVKCLLFGLGEYEKIRKIIVNKTRQQL